MCSTCNASNLQLYHLPSVQELAETQREAAQVVELLDLRQGGLAQTLDGGFPELRTSVWQSEGSVQSAVQVPCHRCLPVPGKEKKVQI